MAQGANLALEDAWVLAKCLSNTSLTKTDLQAYQDMRKKRVERIISVAEGNAWKYHLTFPPLRWAAHRTMWAMSQVMPGRMVEKFDWIYRYDATAET
jgi:salicylate hydroxylase